MSIPHKILYLLAAVIVFGSVFCPCPAEAGNDEGGHAHHQGGQEAPATDCQHAHCVTDCRRLSADSSPQDAALPCHSKSALANLDPDHAVPIGPELTSWPRRSLPVRWKTPPPRPTLLAVDTPVRRSDRLLD